MFKYSTPANIDDLKNEDGTERPTRGAFLNDWHTSLKQNFDSEIAALPPTHRLFFTETVSAATSADIPIVWDAFPLTIKREFPDDPIARWSAADELRNVERGVAPASALMPCRLQDEYCEWFAYRQTPAGPITRIVFTAEAPEYWIMLAKHDFDAVLHLYRKHVSPAVQDADLRLTQDIEFGDGVLLSGSYNPYNIWNTSQGVIHLTHPANTLGAEINLAARATIPRKGTTGTRVTEVRRFACSSNFGDPNRSSDPNIGHGVNMTVLPNTPGATSQSVTLANPVALYINNIANGSVTDMNGNTLAGWFRIIRGVAGRGLMAVLEPPPGSALGLHQIKVNGRALTHGGQVADGIQMVLYGKTANLGHATPSLVSRVRHCCGPTNPPQAAKVNFDHKSLAQSCPGGPSGDAYSELAPGAPGPGVTAEVGDAPLALTRSSKPLGK